MARFLAVALVVAAVACSTDVGARVTAEDFGDDWPLTVEEARVDCVRGGLPVLVIDDDVFGLTGAAYTQLDYAKELPDRLWRDRSDGVGKVDIGPLRARALEEC